MTINPIEWSDEFSVGIESIDEQHKKLINMIKNLYDALANGRVSDVMDEIFSGMFDYTDQHFSYEETLFDKYDYPDAEAHKEEHAELHRQLVKLKNDIYSGDHFMSEVLLLKFLEDWLINHILKTDKKFGPYLIEKGVK
jgi:hemerythrin-like metal-binding protein